MVCDRQITVRPYVPEDYDQVSSWFARRGSACPPAAILPRLGCVAELDGEPAAAAWLYMDNSIGVCFLEWLVTAPSQTIMESRDAVRHLLQFLSGHAKDLDYSVMFASILRDSMVRLAEAEGFQQGGVGYTHLYKTL